MSSSHYVELVDLYPTLAELAGLPRDSKCQGQSLVPLLRDPEVLLPKADALIQVNGGFGLRAGKWAWMWYPPSKKNRAEGFTLYDLELDPEQYTNLAGDPRFAAVGERLHARLRERIAIAKTHGASP